VSFRRRNNLFNSRKPVVFQTSIGIWDYVVCLRLLGNGRLFLLHAVHDEDRYIRAVCVLPAIYLAMVDRDVFVKRIVFLEL
jgi:hypothetical protein